MSPACRPDRCQTCCRAANPRELIREYYRLRRRARVLAAAGTGGAASPGTSGGISGAFDTFDADDAGQLREAFLAWYTARHGVTPQGEDVGTIIQEWGPRKLPDQSWFYACSPHRIEMTAILIRDGYLSDYANAALRLLPEWTQWCIERSGLTGDFAARSHDAALTEAATLVDEEADEGAGGERPRTVPPPGVSNGLGLIPALNQGRCLNGRCDLLLALGRGGALAARIQLQDQPSQTCKPPRVAHHVLQAPGISGWTVGLVRSGYVHFFSWFSQASRSAAEAPPGLPAPSPSLVSA